MYDTKLAGKYDTIYKDKDYSGECDFIERAVKKFSSINKFSGNQVESILDVGCGTGNHAFILSKRGYDVWGEDFSFAMINEAICKKNVQLLLEFSHPHVPEEKKDFDLCISMFHVVNAINDLTELTEYFKYISSKLKVGGLFIFDCWNEHAVVIDPPKESEKRHYGVPDFKISSTPTFDWLESSVTLKNKYTEAGYTSPPCSFTFFLDLTIWQNKVYLDLLKSNNIELVRVCKPFEVNTRAEKNDYKIIYVCKKVR